MKFYGIYSEAVKETLIEVREESAAALASGDVPAYVGAAAAEHHARAFLAKVIDKATENANEVTEYLREEYGIDYEV